MVIHPMQYELEQARQADYERRAKEQRRVAADEQGPAAHGSFARHFITWLFDAIVARGPSPVALHPVGHVFDPFSTQGCALRAQGNCGKRAS